MLVAALGWQDYHRHCFSSGTEEFGVPDPELDFSKERHVSLGELIGGVGDRLRYTYDFGDDWQHEIVVEDLLDPDPETHYPALVAAKGACPPEDCGGPWGYANLKEILADPSHNDHQEMLDWFGLNVASEFDPAASQPTTSRRNSPSAAQATDKPGWPGPANSIPVFDPPSRATVATGPVGPGRNPSG
jgi:hypothetical protein